MKCRTQFVGGRLAAKSRRRPHRAPESSLQFGPACPAEKDKSAAYVKYPIARQRRGPLVCCQNMVQNCNQVRLALENLIIRGSVFAANSIGTRSARVLQHDAVFVRS